MIPYDFNMIPYDFNMIPYDFNYIPYDFNSSIIPISPLTLKSLWFLLRHPICPRWLPLSDSSIV